MELQITSVNSILAEAARLENEGYQFRNVEKYVAARDQYECAATGYREILQSATDAGFREKVMLKIAEMEDRGKTIQKWLDANSATDLAQRSASLGSVTPHKSVHETTSLDDDTQDLKRSKSRPVTRTNFGAGAVPRQALTLQGMQSVIRDMECDPFGTQGEPSHNHAEKSRGEAERAIDRDIALFQSALDGASASRDETLRLKGVAGLESAKVALKEAVIDPVMNSGASTTKRKPWRGVLLYGPAGAGKTLLAKAVTTEVDAKTFHLSSAAMLTNFEAVAVDVLHEVFRMARETQPSTIFIDDVDILVASSTNKPINQELQKVLFQLMREIETQGEKVLVLAATRVPWELDPAIRLRFGKRVYVSLPNKRARVKILDAHLALMEHCLEPEHFLLLGKMTEGFSGTDIEEVARDTLLAKTKSVTDVQFVKFHPGVDPTSGEKLSSWIPCRADDSEAVAVTESRVDRTSLRPGPMNIDDFDNILRNRRPTVTPEEVQKSVTFTEEFGQGEN